MARKVHLDTGYIFIPASNIITIDKAIPQEKLLLITNLNSNTVVFNFSDPNLKTSTYVRTRDSQLSITGTPGSNVVTNLSPNVTPIVGQRITGYGIPDNSYISVVSGTSLTLTTNTGAAANLTADPYQFGHPANIFGTVITLNYNTSSMNRSDKLQIFVDEYEETIRPAETFNDPVSKMRVSTPQALIDTDFELGLQPTKWESLQKLSNRSSFFYNPTTPINVRGIKPTAGTRTLKIDTLKVLTGTGAASTAGATSIGGNNTLFTSEVIGAGAVIFNVTQGNLVGAIAASGTFNDTTLPIKTNGTINNVTNGDTLAVTGTRYLTNGAAGTGIFSPTGTLVAIGSAGSTATLSGSSTTFTVDIRPGDYIFNQNGTWIGQVRTVDSDTQVTLTATNAVIVTAGYFYVSQYTPSFTSAGGTNANISYGNPLYVQLTALPDANGAWLIDGITSSGFSPTGSTTVYQAATEVCYTMENTSPNLTITGGSVVNGSIVTLTFASYGNAPFQPGQLIDVAGATPAGLNRTGATVIACTATSVTYDTNNATVGAWSSGGTIAFNTIFDNPTTYAYPGNFFYNQQLGGSRLALTANAASVSNSVVTINFPAQTQPPFVPGQYITVTGLSATTGNFNGTTSVIDCTTSAVRIANVGGGSGTQTTVGSIAGAQATFYTDGGNISGFSKITVVFDDPHGLLPGAPIFVVGQQSTLNGAWYVASVPNANTIVYAVASAVTSVTNQNQGFVYARPTGNVVHRPTDGGIQISCSINSPNAQMIRQSRRYFRYQSGKGIQYSTGTVLKPTLRINKLTSDGTSVTVFCKEPHFMYPGCQVRVSGATVATGSYNGVFTVIADGLSPKTFKYTPASNAPAVGTAGGFPINVAVDSWSGAQNRLGLFDGTNGMFFKFDGQTLSTVRRNSTELLAGNVQVTNGSALVTGDADARFSEQLKAGHHVVIRGQIYYVTSVYSNNAITISPEYRGTSITSGSYAKIARVQDYEVPQSQWNIDKCDGTGPSGYVLDLAKIQMWYIDYTWYGAGAIRFGFKDQRGEVIYCNRIAHANNRTEAYLRSGNIAARYETNTFQPNTNLTTSGLASTVTTNGTIPVADVSSWPASGGVLIMPPPTGVTNSYASASSGTPSLTSGVLQLTFGTAITAAQAAAIPIGSIAEVRNVNNLVTGQNNGVGVVTAVSTTAISIYYVTAPTATAITAAGTIFTAAGAFEYITYSAKNTTASPHTLTVASRALGGYATVTGSITSGSNNITGVTTAGSNVTPFMHVHGTGIPLGTYVVGVSGTTVYMSNTATVTNASATFNFSTPGAQGANTFSPTATQPYQAMYFNPMFSPTISHWGSSVIMDGRFDDDKALIFTAGMKGTLSTSTIGVAYPLISIRVGPSVDTGIADILGRKEIINRMQLILNALDVSFSTQHILDLRLNGQLSGGTWQSVGGSSLAQICYHTNTQRISGGESTYTFLTGTTAGVQTYNLDKARDLGNSILGGGYTANVKDTFYPDGPDIITLVATPIAVGSVLARISWTEAQA